MPMPKKLKAVPTQLRANVQGRPIGVDRKENVLRGYVMAQAKVFRTPGRGEFDLPAIREIVRLANQTPRGLRSNFTHASASNDSLGRHLGRVRGAYVDGDLARGNLHFDKTALEEPPGGGKPYAQYVMDLAESDPGALSSSLVIEADQEQRQDRDGKLVLDADGEPLPPLWKPRRLLGSDVVAVGEAVDDILSPGELAEALSVGLTPDLAKLLRFDNVARLASQLLDGFFKGQDRQVIEARCQAWLARYLSLRFGGDEAQLAAGPVMECPHCTGPLGCEACGWKSGEAAPYEGEEEGEGEGEGEPEETPTEEPALGVRAGKTPRLDAVRGRLARVADAARKMALPRR